MIRTQIQLTEDQARALRELAAREGRSLADLVREGVGDLLRQRRVPRAGRDELVSRAIAACGRFRSGLSDLGRGHDAYLGEELARWTSSSTPRR